MGGAIEFCRKLGWQNIDLMVIPQTETKEPQRLAEFKVFLQEQSKRGVRLWLHGFKHKADRENQGSLKGRLVQKMCRGEAEFCGLSLAEAKHRYTLALSAWEELGIGSPEGFVPPTWHDERNFRFWLVTQGVKYESRLGIYERGKKEWSLPVSLMDRPGLWQMSKWILTPLLYLGLGRIVLHPYDFEDEQREKTQNWLKGISEKVFI